jgi:hypothetical protein
MASGQRFNLGEAGCRAVHLPVARAKSPSHAVDIPETCFADARPSEDAPEREWRSRSNFKNVP